MDKPKDNFEYEDVDSWGGGSGKGVGIKEISLNRFQRAMLEGGKEMTGGGVQTRVIDGQVIQIAVPDQREIFINCVKMSHITIIPKINALKEEDDLKKKFIAWEDNNKTIKKTYVDKLRRLQQDYKSKPQDYLAPNGNSSEEYNIKYTIIKEKLDLDRVEESRELLILISLLLHSLNYFDEGGLHA